ncbi:hypothetical protein FACS1894116_10000 [Betaproteobacteria bacterium]|nr:hypothetical protein AGMMS49543_19110 [Betaproteobacteria bacterium]GHT95070.1 hypothetical protein FACS1894116_10000 [Betaproteobacteria bacterium]GHT99587.1 hypothetical protein FACS1894154_06970 [Betaproteobacteria bacterium]GHU12496.1 hypothetical protein AGMMS50225_20510 [Betaproteobacteria bacterium]GHU22310.1 hypothetical protein AGMMS50243_21630 [Betaproteobacteria bacterium]
MSLMRAIPLILALGFAPMASAQVYKCVNADDNRVTYTNDRDAAKAKGCKVLDAEQAVSTISMNPKATPTPATFPKVTNDSQRERDSARRQVLETERGGELQALEAARQALAEQEGIRNGDEHNYQKVLDRVQPYKDKVEQHERNLEALNKEISNLN